MTKKRTRKKPLRRRLRVRELRLRHFRAFEDARLNLDNLTVLVGKNGSGKSTILDALSFMREAVTERLVDALDRRDGLDRIRQRQQGKRRHHVSLSLRMELGEDSVIYGFTLGGKRGGSGFEVKSEVLDTTDGARCFHRGQADFEAGDAVEVQPVVDPETLLLPVIAGSCPLWTSVWETIRCLRVHRLSTDALRRDTEIRTGMWLRSDGGNAANVLKELGRSSAGEKKIKWIIEHLAGVTPGIEHIGVGVADGRRYMTFGQAMSGEYRECFYGGQVSDGTLRVLGVLLALQQVDRPSLVAIDEIEDSIHPAALAVLLDAIEASLGQCSVLITSHSPEALTHPAVTGQCVRVLQWDEGVSSVYSLNDSTIESIQPPMSVGRLLRANALWPSEKPCTIGGRVFELD